LLLEQDDTKTATGPDPEALIEEARQLQRQRTKRRAIVLQAAGLLVILGVGISQLARGGSSAGPALAGPAANSARVPTVTFAKDVVQKFVPHLPIETRTTEAWWSSTTPEIQRAVATIPSGRRLEIGSVYKHDKLAGPEEVGSLYDGATNTIYEVAQLLGPKYLTPKQVFKQILTDPHARLEGTRTYEGRSVYVIVIRTPNLPITKQTSYVDKRTYEVVAIEIVGNDLRIVSRFHYRTLPATKANLALTSLQAAHPGARISRNLPPRIRKLAAQAFHGQYR
jgi:hypothetical protein